MLFAKPGVITHLYLSLAWCQKNCTSVISGGDVWLLPGAKGKLPETFICNDWIVSSLRLQPSPTGERGACFLPVPPGGHTIPKVRAGGAEVCGTGSRSINPGCWPPCKGGRKAWLEQMAKPSFSCSAPLHLLQVYRHSLVSLKSKGAAEKSA